MLPRYIIGRRDVLLAFQNASKASATAILDLKLHLLQCCTDTWLGVHDVLCYDAPEGRNLTDEEGDDVDMDGKDVLSFCWRALKESR